MVFIVLSLVQTLPPKPILLFERIYPGAGWLQILVVCYYAYIVASHMRYPEQSALWRKRIWIFFSIIFFSQLFLGLMVSSLFLLSGKLHFPIPAIIIAGSIYRGEIGMMPVLLVSMILLSGPAWCSSICYFGGVDNYFASNLPHSSFTVNNRFKLSVLLAVCFLSILLHFTQPPKEVPFYLATSFGIIGLLIILIGSRKKRVMVHCTIYCPIGTIVQYIKKISPFRLTIDSNCSSCNHCQQFCNYAALEPVHLAAKTPGATCTLCGDCLSICPRGSIKYKFSHVHPDTARCLWLFLTISLHSITLAIARI